MLFRFFVHFSDLFCVNARRLVAKHVQPCFHRVDCDLRVEIVRGFDHNDVDKSRRKHIMIVIKDFNAFEVFFGVLATFR